MYVCMEFTNIHGITFYLDVCQCCCNVLHKLLGKVTDKYRTCSFPHCHVQLFIINVIVD